MANIFFAAFVIVSNFVLLQLVIAVLMEQLEEGQENEEGLSKVPGCEHLDKHIMQYVHIHEQLCKSTRTLEIVLHHFLASALRSYLNARKLHSISSATRG